VYAKGREVDLTAAGTEKSRAEARHFEQVVPRGGPLLPVAPASRPPIDRAHENDGVAAVP
jgi:hypothetical protein